MKILLFISSPTYFKERIEFCYANLIFCGTGLVTTQLKNAYNNLWTSTFIFLLPVMTTCFWNHSTRLQVRDYCFPLKKRNWKRKYCIFFPVNGGFFFHFLYFKMRTGLKAQIFSKPETPFYKNADCKSKLYILSKWDLGERRLCSFNIREL